MTPSPRWVELGSQASYYHRHGLSERGIGPMKEAIELLRQEPALKDQLASTLNYLANMLLAIGRLDEAEAAIREAMQFDSGRGDQIRATNLMVLAKVLHQQGRREEAIRTGKESLRMFRKELGWGSKLYRQYKEMVADFKKPPAPKAAAVEPAGRGAA